MNYKLLVILFIIVLLTLPQCSSTKDNTITDNYKPDTITQINSAAKSYKIKGSITLDDIISYFVTHNPELKSLQAKINAADSSIRQSGLLPNPSLHAGVDQIPTNNLKVNEGRRSIGVAEPIELGGKRASRIQFAKEQKNIATLDYEARLSELILEAKNVFNNVLLAQSELLLTRERLDFEIKLLDIIQKSYVAGRLTQAEFLNSEQKLAQARISLQGKEETLKNELHNLRKLLSIDESTPLECSTKLEPLFYGVKPDKIKETMLANHPRIKLRQSSIKLTEAQLAEDRAGRIPDLKVGLDYMEPGQGIPNMLGLNIELPLPIFNQNQGKIAQTQSELIAAQEQLQAVENDLITAFNQAVNNYQLAADNMTLYESKIMPNEEKQYKIVEESYKFGRISHQEALTARIKLIDTTLAYLRLIKVLNDASAELEYLAGKPQ